MNNSPRSYSFALLRTSAIALAASLALNTGTAFAAPPELGVWYDDTGRGAVEIVPCADRLCGYIVWLKDPLNSKGQPLRDVYNPNQGDRNRPICGIQILGDLQPQSDGSWDQGWVYDPKVGKSYNVQISLKGPDDLLVYGYAGVKLFGKKLAWRRAPQDLPRCDEQAKPIQAGQ